MHVKLIAIRHGETTSNQEDKVSGGNDNPFLTKKGYNQAELAALKLHGRVNQVFSSPKERCRATGRIAFGLPIFKELADLNERYYGRFDSGPNDDWKSFMDSLKPRLDTLDDEEKRNFDFGPGIENEQQLIERSLGAFAIVGDESKGQPTGISTSGGIIRGVLLGMNYDLPTGSIDNLARLEVDYDGNTFSVVDHEGIKELTCPKPNH